MAESPQEPAFVLPESYAALRLRGLTPGQIRGPGWRQTSRGFYVPARTVESPLQRVANAAARLPAGGAVGTWGAALLHGVQWYDGYAPDGRTPLPVMLFTGPEAHVRALGCRVSQEPLPPTDTQQRYGIACTTPVRTCFDGMRLAADLEEAVVFADMMLAAEVVRIDDLESCIADRAGWRGLPRSRSVIALADSRAKGPWETRLRMVWMLGAGLPRPLVNTPVFDLDGVLIGVPDLFDPGAAVAWEFDGGGHRQARQHARDNIREERFEEAGILVGRTSALDFANRAALAERMRRTYRRGRQRDRRLAAWTLSAPPNWGPMGAEAELRSLLLEMDP